MNHTKCRVTGCWEFSPQIPVFFWEQTALKWSTNRGPLLAYFVFCYIFWCVNVQWQNLGDMAKYVQRWSLPPFQVDIMTTHGPYMLVLPSDVNSWSIYHDCWCHEPHIHFYPSALLPCLFIDFLAIQLLWLFCAHVAPHISDLLSMSPHLRLNVWPPIEREVAIILCNAPAASYYCATARAGVLIMLSL